MRLRKRGKQGGFTLMEVLVSLVLSAVGMIGVIALYRASTSASSFSRRGTEATILAQDKLERLRTDTSTTNTTETGIDEMGKAGGLFTRTSTITAEVVNVPPRYHEIVVDVTWSEEGVNRTITVRGRRNIP